MEADDTKVSEAMGLLEGLLGDDSSAVLAIKQVVEAKRAAEKPEESKEKPVGALLVQLSRKHFRLQNRVDKQREQVVQATELVERAQLALEVEKQEMQLLEEQLDTCKTERARVAAHVADAPQVGLVERFGLEAASTSSNAAIKEQFDQMQLLHKQMEEMAARIKIGIEHDFEGDANMQDTDDDYHLDLDSFGGSDPDGANTRK